jgi:hypothetical protein
MKTISTICFATLITATCAMAQTNILIPYTYASPATGIAQGQTAKWNIAFPPASNPNETRPPCAATLSIRNERGDVLKTAEVSVGPGQIRSLELVDTDLPAGGRTAIHAFAFVPVTSPNDQPLPAGQCGLQTSLEIVENASGKTTVVVPGAQIQPSARFLPLPGMPQ